MTTATTHDYGLGSISRSDCPNHGQLNLYLDILMAFDRVIHSLAELFSHSSFLILVQSIFFSFSCCSRSSTSDHQKLNLLEHFIAGPKTNEASERCWNGRVVRMLMWRLRCLGSIPAAWRQSGFLFVWHHCTQNNNELMWRAKRHL